MLKYLKTDIPGVLKWAEDHNFSSFHQQRDFGYGSVTKMFV